MAEDEQKIDDSNGFMISNLTASLIIGLIIFLGVVILYQNYRLGIVIDTVELLLNKVVELKPK